MRISALLAAAVIASPAAAQISIVRPSEGAGPARIMRAFADQPRAVIGITTSGSATNRDTLGVLVSSVRPGSPADKAGIEEGNRIASINGVSLRLAAIDVGEYEMAGAMTRRLTRELNKLKPGDEVELRVYAGSQAKTVKVKTIAPEDLNEASSRRRDADRATLGVNIAITGSARDSIGVFVLSVEDGSPAAKAGIEEGSRIASVNGVAVGGRRSADDDDHFMRAAGVNRLEREMAKVKPGDDVDLRVYYNGQFRNVKVKAVSVRDLPRRNRSITIMGGDNFMSPPFPPLPDRITVDAPEFGTELRRAIEGARVMGGAVGGAMAGVMPRMGNRVSW